MDSGPRLAATSMVSTDIRLQPAWLVSVGVRSGCGPVCSWAGDGPRTAQHITASDRGQQSVVRGTLRSCHHISQLRI